MIDCKKECKNFIILMLFVFTVQCSWYSKHVLVTLIFGVTYHFAQYIFMYQCMFREIDLQQSPRLVIAKINTEALENVIPQFKRSSTCNNRKINICVGY